MCASDWIRTISRSNGKIIGIEPKIDPVTRLVLIRAQIENPDGKLSPGQFVQASVTLPEEDNVIAVPQTAVVTSLYGDYVYAVRPAGETSRGRQSRPTRRSPPKARASRPRRLRRPRLRTPLPRRAKQRLKRSLPRHPPRRRPPQRTQRRRQTSLQRQASPQRQDQASWRDRSSSRPAAVRPDL